MLNANTEGTVNTKPIRKLTPQQVAVITARLVNEEKQRVTKHELEASAKAIQAMRNGCDLSLFEALSPVVA